jgi:hypothetical protein
MAPLNSSPFLLCESDMNRLSISPAINHERLEDEVIAINLETGAYYAIQAAGADCWSVAAAGGGIDAMVQALVSRFEVDEAQARADVESFVAALLSSGLASSAEGSPSTDGVLPPHQPRAPYAPPQLQGFEDLEDLLLIDPIHEVDEAGWPLPAPAVDR